MNLIWKATSFSAKDSSRVFLFIFDNKHIQKHLKGVSAFHCVLLFGF